MLLGQPTTGARSLTEDRASTALPEDASAYWAFYDQVAVGQVVDWAPRRPSTVLDLSGSASGHAVTLAEAGHTVLRASPEAPSAEVQAAPGVLRVQADPATLSWLADGTCDAVLAESRTLPCLGLEVLADDLFRVLRPGGRLLIVVDSLLLGLGQLAEQERWAELADVGSADVLLVEQPGGGLTRCFLADELRALLTQSGFQVAWVRPRTVLTPLAVDHALAQGGRSTLSRLVASENQMSPTHAGEDLGLHLVASAARPG